MNHKNRPVSMLVEIKNRFGKLKILLAHGIQDR